MGGRFTSTRLSTLEKTSEVSATRRKSQSYTTKPCTWLADTSLTPNALRPALVQLEWEIENAPNRGGKLLVGLDGVPGFASFAHE
jgi:hypothetical protein